jgi:hypothetical protein
VNRSQLRPLSGYFDSVISVAKHRGLALLTEAAVIWGLFAVATVALSYAVIDRGVVNDIILHVTRILTLAEQLGVSSPTLLGLKEYLSNTLTTGEWLRYGYTTSAVILFAWFVFYVFTVSVATTTSVYQAWEWLTSETRTPVWVAIRYGLKRAPRAAFGFLMWVTVLAFVSVVFIYAPVGFFIFRDQLWLAVLVGLLGAGVSFVVFLWLASKWALTSQAAALAGDQSFRVLRESSQVTKGSRLAVLGRWLLLGMVVSLVTGAILTPLPYIAGMLPSGMGTFVTVFCFRVALTATQGVFNAAGNTSVYIDLGGNQTAAANNTEPLAVAESDIFPRNEENPPPVAPFR